jgi:HlyD family secretion protein
MSKKIIFIAISLIALVSISISYIINSAIEVETVVVRKGNFEEVIREEGSVVPNTYYHLVSQLSGIVEEVYKSEGDIVKKGEAVLKINTENLQFKVESLRGKLISIEGADKKKNGDLLAQESVVESSKESYIKFKKEYERGLKLFESGSISESDLEDFKLKMIKGESEYETQFSILQSKKKNNEGRTIEIESNIDALEMDIENSTLRSAIKGVLSNFDLKEGDGVEALSIVGDVISEDREEIEVMVLADKVYGLSLEQRARIIRERAGVKDEIVGYISYISPRAVERVSTLGIKEKRVKVKIKCDEYIEPKLILGSDVDVEFIINRVENTITIPKTALFFSENGEAVWIVRENVIKMVNVKTGYETSKSVQILDGLREGDIIVKYYDTDDVKENARVK